MKLEIAIVLTSVGLMTDAVSVRFTRAAILLCTRVTALTTTTVLPHKEAAIASSTVNGMMIAAKQPHWIGVLLRPLIIPHSTMSQDVMTVNLLPRL